MKNIEKYEKELKALGTYFRVTREGLLKRCDGKCKYCVFNTSGCGIKRIEWLLQECKEPILTEEDKRILKDVINVFNSFKKEIVDIRKRDICKEYYLYINYIDGGEDVSSIETHTTLPFNGDKLFKGMKLDKRYTLEELGL